MARWNGSKMMRALVVGVCVFLAAFWVVQEVQRRTGEPRQRQCGGSEEPDEGEACAFLAANKDAAGEEAEAHASAGPTEELRSSTARSRPRPHSGDRRFCRSRAVEKIISEGRCTAIVG